MNKLLLSFLTSVTLMSSPAFAMEEAKSTSPRIAKGPAHQIWDALFSDGAQKPQHPMWSSVLSHVEAAMVKSEIPEYGFDRQPITERDFPGVEQRLQDMARQIANTQDYIKRRRYACEEKLGHQWNDSGERICEAFPFSDDEKADIEEAIHDDKEGGNILDQMRIEGNLLYRPKSEIREHSDIENFVKSMIQLRDAETMLKRRTEHFQQQKAIAAEARRIREAREADPEFIAQRAKEEAARIQRQKDEEAARIQMQKEAEEEAKNALINQQKGKEAVFDAKIVDAKANLAAAEERTNKLSSVPIIVDEKKYDNETNVERLSNSHADRLQRLKEYERTRGIELWKHIDDPWLAHGIASVKLDLALMDKRLWELTQPH